MRTREEILAVIDRGETINIKGIDYNKNNRHDVPSEADLAAGDERKEAEAEQSIQKKMEQLQAELKKLEQLKASRKAETTETSDDTSKKGGVVTGEKAQEPKKEEATKAESKSESKAEAKSEAKK
jgi:hypothetical protein